MSRNSWIMFGMIAVAIMSIVLVALLIFVPQSQPIVEGNVEDYVQIDRSVYSYTQSKDISKDAMKETYSVTTEDVKEGKASKLYRQGNTDPFADPNASQNTNTNNTNTGNANNATNSGSNQTGNGNNSSGATSSSTPNDRPVSADDK